MNNKRRNNVAQKHDYQINFDLIDGVSSNTQNPKRKTTTSKLQNLYVPKKKTKPVATKQVEAPKKVGPFVPAQMPKPQTPEIVNYPVYFFNPVEIDGKLWVPQPVFPQMLNWDKEKGEFQFPTAPVPGQAPTPVAVPPKVKTPKAEPAFEVKQPVVEQKIPETKDEKVDPLKAFRDEVEQAPVAPKPSATNIKKNLRPIPIKKVAPAVAGASVAAKPIKAKATKKKIHDVEFNSSPNKFVAPWVQHKNDKTQKKVKQSKKIKSETSAVPEAFDTFATSSVRAVVSDSLMRRLLRILLWILIVLFIYFEVMLVASKPNSNGDVSFLFGKGAVQQETKDMYPSINYGDLCFIGAQSSYNVNSIIAYVNDDNELVLHRYLGVDSSGNARAKADTSKMIDNSFNRSNIVGKVEFVMPFAGFLVTFFIDKIILVLLVASLIACYVWKAKRKHT